MQHEHGPLRVGVVEAQALFRGAWGAIVNAGDLELAAVVASPEDLPASGCDVVVLDVDGQPEPCATLIMRIWSRAGRVPVCAIALRPTLDVLTAHDNGDAVLVLKTSPPSQVRAAIWAAARRERVAIA